MLGSGCIKCPSIGCCIGVVHVRDKATSSCLFSVLCCEKSSRFRITDNKGVVYLVCFVVISEDDMRSKYCYVLPYICLLRL